MAMSRKNYVATAQTIKNELLEIREYSDRYVIHSSLVSVASGMADMFAMDNSAFRRDTFMTACGFERDKNGRWAVTPDLGGFVDYTPVESTSHVVNRGSW